MSFTSLEESLTYVQKNNIGTIDDSLNGLLTMLNSEALGYEVILKFIAFGNGLDLDQKRFVAAEAAVKAQEITGSLGLNMGNCTFSDLPSHRQSAVYSVFWASDAQPKDSTVYFALQDALEAGWKVGKTSEVMDTIKKAVLETVEER